MDRQSKVNAAGAAAPLANVANDARDITAALEKLDHAVSLRLDLAAGQFVAVALRFYATIDEPGAITLFYYAGHALQYEQGNFLVPVNTVIDTPDALGQHAFPLDRLLFLIGESAAASLDGKETSILS